MKRSVTELLDPDAVRAADKAFPDIPTIGMKLSDYGNAERLVARYRDRIRYCPPKHAWLIWDSKRWRWDLTGEIVRLAKKTVRGIYAEAEHAKSEDAAKAIAQHAQRSENGARIGEMIKLAQTEAGIPVLPDELDADPWKLNADNGTIDLKTGKIGPHARSDLITKLIAVAYDPAAKHELWDRFVQEATGGDADLAAFLKRAAGYFATGLTSEKRFFFVFSRKHDTGKSTFADAIRAGLGEYAMDADFETWLEQSSTGGNRGDVARLTGARLVISVEVRRRAKFDTKLVKAITGGDPITCAAKYEKEFSYKPTFKILLVANEPPSIRDDDKPMFERCLRVPFDVQIPADKRDPEMKRRLSDPSDTGPAILRWIVDGAREWHSAGLGVPPAVRKSSDDYAAEMDRFGGFVAECCILERGVSVTKRALRAAYEAWCEDNGIKHPMTVREVGDRLKSEDFGLTDGSTGPDRIWKGIRLRTPTDATDATDAFSQNSPHEAHIEEVPGNGVSDVSSVSDWPPGWTADDEARWSAMPYALRGKRGAQ
jgi:putative DNA primase/helicase